MPTPDAIAPQAPEEQQFYETAVQLVRSGQGAVRRAANMAMVYTYFELGRIIIEQEQRGQGRAGYGARMLQGLSQRLTREFGRGFSMTNLEQIRKFYRVYSSASIPQTLSEEFDDMPVATGGRKFVLSWSHYVFLMGIENEGERSFYEIESARGGWSLAELRRQFNSALYERKHFKVDLVCYNRLLRCYVLFDLKIGELTHQDLGQMQMYVNYYDRHVRFADENPTIGVLLCSRKNDAIVELTLPEDNEQIFASRYQTVLPSKEELKKIIQEGQEEYETNSPDTV